VLLHYDATCGCAFDNNNTVTALRELADKVRYRGLGYVVRCVVREEKSDLVNFHSGQSGNAAA
jgi:hypothetical protein